jgi:hypothetical protein
VSKRAETRILEVNGAGAHGGEGGSDTVQGVERVVGVTDDSPST